MWKKFIVGKKTAINPINDLQKRNQRVFAVPAQHEFGIFGNILLHQIPQQGLHDVGEVLQLVVECHGEQWRYVAAVPLGEVLLLLQGVDKLQKQTISFKTTS